MEVKKERNYGIDMLRLISMLMVVVLHVLGSGALSHFGILSVSGLFLWFIEALCFCAVNCFAVVSGYVGINSKHKSEGIISICLHAIFYCIIFTAIYLVLVIAGVWKLELSFLLKSVLPTLMNKYWYLSAYFCLFFFMPILDRVVEMPRDILKKTGIFIFIVFCFLTQIRDSVSALKGGYSFLWLAVLYVFGGYIAKYKPFEKISQKANVLGFFICGAVMLISKISIVLLSSFLPSFLSDVLFSYTSPTVLLASVFLVNIFSRSSLPVGIEKIVAFAAPASFGIYLIHCHPVFLDKLLPLAVSKILSFNTALALLLVLGCIALVFFGCLVIDILRIKLFGVLRVNKLIALIQKIFSRLFGRFLTIK